MNKEEFINVAIARLAGAWNPDPPSPQDLEFTRLGAEDCFKRGFDMSDTIAYLRNLEHVNETICLSLSGRRWQWSWKHGGEVEFALGRLR